ncbi:MAG TPA: DEAD/DEAH box helicase [Thermoplasmata archaeon]|nr:DEAD/DEAH box helicase [Thermoplasmata archaeon]
MSGGRQRQLDDFASDSAESAVPRVWLPPPALPGIWQESDGAVVHPLLTPGAIRALPFQLEMAHAALTDDLLVVLPTGLGKTVIAALVAAERLRPREGKLLFLAPTRPLVLQHQEALGRWFVRLQSARFTGTVKHPVREGAWESADAVFATPEIVANDLAAGRYDLSSVVLLIFDEAHHAVGKYAYVPIAERYRTDRPPSGHVLGLTASPGGRDERIEEVVDHLGFGRIEARSRDDPGVAEFVQAVDVDFRFVRLPPEALRVRAHLQGAAHDEARKLQKMGYLRRKPIANLAVRDLIDLRAEIFARPGPMVRKFGPLFHQLVLLHLHHATERLETQGLVPLVQYLDRVGAKPKPSRGDAAFLKKAGVVAARAEADAFLARGTEPSHPKLDTLLGVIREELAVPRDRPARVLVFAQYRDTILGIEELLGRGEIRARRFVGQARRDADDPGMSQTEQARVLKGFREGAFPVLVASSVAEEGLDVPDVDLVVFFEAVPSEIRAIQRRGRTGRSSLGRVVVLLTEGTRDVGYQAAEVKRERAMRRIVRRLSDEARGRRAREKSEANVADPGSTRPRRPRRTSVSADSSATQPKYRATR